MGLLSTLGCGESVLLVFWWFSGLFRPMWWNLSNQEDEVSPASSYTAIFSAIFPVGFLIGIALNQKIALGIV